MFRKKDFNYMDVFNDEGIKIGVVKDLLIDYNERNVVGFEITEKKLFNKGTNVFMEDLICFDKKIITRCISERQALKFNQIYNMDIWDTNGEILGMLEDIIFDNKSFEIKAAIISGGFIKNYKTGKKVVLLKDLIMGEKNMLYYKNRTNVYFYSLPNYKL